MRNSKLEPLSVISVTELSRLSGLNRSHLSTILNGSRAIGIRSLTKIAKAFDISMEAALEGIQKRQSLAKQIKAVNEQTSMIQDESFPVDFQVSEAEPNMELTPEEEDEWANALAIGE